MINSTPVHQVKSKPLRELRGQTDSGLSNHSLIRFNHPEKSLVIDESPIPKVHIVRARSAKTVKFEETELKLNYDYFPPKKSKENVDRSKTVSVSFVDEPFQNKNSTKIISDAASCVDHKNVREELSYLNLSGRTRASRIINSSHQPRNADDSEYSLCDSSQLSERMSRLRNPPFPKFIPLRVGAAGRAPYEVPRLAQNMRAPAEWDLTQAHYTSRRCGGDVSDIGASRSDTALVLRRRATNNLRRVFCLPSADSDPESVPLELLQAYDRSVRIPQRDDPRVSESSNTQYCRVSCGATAEFSAALHVQQRSGECAALRHLRADMAVTSMLHFFYPYADVQFYWVASAHDKILSLLKEGDYMPRFTRLVYLRTFEATLVVSADAGVLLRHKELSFLRSLADALDINHNKLLVLVNES